MLVHVCLVGEDQVDKGEDNPLGSDFALVTLEVSFFLFDQALKQVEGQLGTLKGEAVDVTELFGSEGEGWLVDVVVIVVDDLRTH